VQQWLLPELPVRPNHSRAEEAALATSECDPSSPGLVRDWNNDLQEIRELPIATRQQRLFRDRLLTKVRACLVRAVRECRGYTLDPQTRCSLLTQLNSDFVAASARGAQAIINGDWTPHVSILFAVCDDPLCSFF
jgi:hypothetical protein